MASDRVGVGYFFVWTVFGLVAFPLVVALAALSRRMPTFRSDLQPPVWSRRGVWRIRSSYPVVSHIAEKLHALTMPRSRPNTR